MASELVRRGWGTLAALVLLAAGGQAQAVGMPMPRPEITGLSQTAAKSFAEFEGRAVLLEFFAHW